MFGVCLETKRCAEMGDRESINPKEGCRQLRLVHDHVVEVGEKKYINLFFF